MADIYVWYCGEYVCSLNCTANLHSFILLLLELELKLEINHFWNLNWIETEINYRYVE